MFLSLLGAALAVFGCSDITAPTSSIRPRTRAGEASASGVVVVSPADMHGWQFVDDATNTACTDTTRCALVSGPGTPPLGSGSAELATPAAADGKALVLQAYAGTRFDHITSLAYSTYRQSSEAGNNLAIALQFNVDYDLTDAATGYQGRLVFEPYQGNGGNVPQSTWQRWDAKAGRWWGTRTSVPKNGVSVTNSCVQATPCTWTQLLAAYPDLGIHATMGAVVLKAGSNWAGFRGNVDSLVIGVDSMTTTFDFEAQAALPPFPATFPGAIPVPLWDSLTAPTNLIINSPQLGGRVIRDLLYVAFKDSASLASRSGALAGIGGRVVGGESLNLYAVRIPYTLSAGDSSTGPLLRAIAALEANPIVEIAIVAYLDGPVAKYRQPKFGPGFDKWPLSPDSASPSADNWNLVGIDAPFAWGCSTGAEVQALPSNVAVVDEGFYAIADVNTGETHEFVDGNHPSDSTEHGTSVASIVAAAGRPTGGITGVMWGTSINLFNIHSIESATESFGGQLGVIRRAMRSGARIINLSLGLSPQPIATPADIHLARTFSKAFRNAVNVELKAHPTLRAPLFVISAGNEGADARWNGYATAAEDTIFRNRFMLVVGASRLQSKGAQVLATFSVGSSNSGSFVDVVAPGYNVTALGKSNQRRLTQGTSIAAPHVTGVAGLLLAADSSISSDSLRSMIIEGAVRGGRVVADSRNPTRPIPILNAYETLKGAARRKGSPLCGNRIWNDGYNNIVVQRGTLTDTIISRPITDYAAYVHPYHGGKRIDVGFSYEYDWKPASRKFEPVSYVSDPTNQSGAWLSYANTSDHDNVVWVERGDTADVQGGQVSRLRLLRNSDNGVVKELQPHHLPGTQTRPTTKACVTEFPVTTYGGSDPYYIDTAAWSGSFTCADSAAVGGWDSAPTRYPDVGTGIETPILGSFAPQGDAVFVPVNIRHIDKEFSAPMKYTCGLTDSLIFNPSGSPGLYTGRQCAVPTLDVDSTVRTMVFRVDTATSTWTLIPIDGAATVRENREINSLEVSEDGKEIMISTTRRASHNEFDGAAACHDETLEWISIDRSLTATFAPGHVNLRIAVPQGASCGGWVEAGGTVSPNRVGGMPTLQTVPQSSRSGSKQPRYVPLRALKAQTRGRAQ